MSRESTAVWMPFLASVGLFLALTVMAQATHPWGPAKEGSEDDDVEQWPDEEEEEDMEDVRKSYRSRRVHDRLSYENIQDFLPPSRERHCPQPLERGPSQGPSLDSLSTLGDENERTIKRGNSNYLIRPSLSNELFDPPSPPPSVPERGLSEWDVQRRSRRGLVSSSSSSFTALERRDSHASLNPHPNSDYDFHPKNRNWRHFEHFNEKDPRRNQNHQPPLHAPTHDTGSPISPTQRQPEDTPTTTIEHPQDQGDPLVRMEDTDEEPSYEDEDEDIETTANSISSSGSDSSEEQFVWMKHSHRRKSPAPSSLKEKMHLWKMSSFLTLFTDPGMEPSAVAETATQDEVVPKQTSSTSSDRNKEPSDKVPTASRRNSMPAAFDSGRPDTPELPPQETSPSLIQLLQRFVVSGFGRPAAMPPSQHLPTQPRPTGLARLSSAPSRMTTASGFHHRLLRTQYNAAIMPEKVILIRHGQSMGNINEVLYSTTPDNAMPLTPLGWVQAREAGQILKDKILTSGQTVHFIVSPYVRTVETFHGMVSAWCDPKDFKHITDKEKRIIAWYRRLMEMGLTWNEDSRIREQDFGNYQDPETIRKAKQERHRFGVFYYRFPHGESASDVFDRVSTFLDSLWRSFEMNKSQNYVLVTHGISIRVLLARYFRYTIDQFNILANPRNCEMVILGHNGEGRLELQGRCALELGPTTTSPPSSDRGMESADETEKTNHGSSKKDDSTTCVTGYRFHKRLRIVPKHAIRKVKIRISPDD